VNEPAGNVKGQEPKQPKNNQNRGDYSKHVFNSFTFERAPMRNPVVTHSTDADFFLDSRLWSQGCQIKYVKSVRYESHPQINSERGQRLV
jgi:hypothetical protein